MSPKIQLKAITILAAAGMVLQPAWSQTGTPPAPPNTGTGTGTGTGTTGTGGGTPTIGRTPTTTVPNRDTTTNPNQNTRPQPQMTQPIFLSGRVMLEDGTVPSGQVVIETVCNGIGHSEGYTDSKGYFGIELGARNGMINDASENGSFRVPGGSMSSQGSSLGSFGGMETPERKYMSCDLQAKLAGYRSQAVSLAGRRPMDDPNVGTILLHRMGAQEEGRTVSAVSLAAPKDAKKAYEKGLDGIKKKKPEEAQKNFEKAVELYPKYATAWYELGMLQVAQKQTEQARQSFDKALEADPKFMKPYLQVAVLQMQAQKWQELADLTEKTVKLDPFDYPQAFFFNSVANFNLKNYEAAEKSALEAERLDTRHQMPKVSHLLGILLAEKQDFTGAAERFRTYLKFAPMASDADKVKTQLDQVEKIAATAAATKDKQ
jgi:tetratricopeptide (TPR) repeat protein